MNVRFQTRICSIGDERGQRVIDRVNDRATIRRGRALGLGHNWVSDSIDCAVRASDEFAPASAHGASMTSRAPTFDVEKSLFDVGHVLVGAMDEVGRGSPFGPCCVGLVVVDATVGPFPSNLRDSKLVTARAREQLVTPLRQWVCEHAVGDASAREIDAWGLTAALRLAGRRALDQISRLPDVIILDGAYDWLSTPIAAALVGPDYPDVGVAPVTTRVKADLTCASVAAASVLAKVHRDALVRNFAVTTPGYDLENNKGYATSSHLAALRELGPSEHHRLSWRLPPRLNP